MYDSNLCSIFTFEKEPSTRTPSIFQEILSSAIYPPHQPRANRHAQTHNHREALKTSFLQHFPTLPDIVRRRISGVSPLDRTPPSPARLDGPALVPTPPLALPRSTRPLSFRARISLSENFRILAVRCVPVTNLGWSLTLSSRSFLSHSTSIFCASSSFSSCRRGLRAEARVLRVCERG